MNAGDYRGLPPDLPVPEDDGAADHLEGMIVPPVSLITTGGSEVDLAVLCEGLAVIFVYPRTGTPGTALPEGWDEIPGARGCTPQSCAYRDRITRFTELGATIFGVSAQPASEQIEFKDREHIPYQLLNDSGLDLNRDLGLPTFEAAGMTLYRRLTFIAAEGVIEKVFYPVFPPDDNATETLEWLGSRAA